MCISLGDSYRLNSEDVFTTLGFGLSNFVGHTQDLLNLAEMRE